MYFIMFLVLSWLQKLLSKNVTLQDYPVDSSAVFLIYLSTITCTFHSIYFMTNIKLFE